jgi:hypothetical protein
MGIVDHVTSFIFCRLSRAHILLDQNPFTTPLDEFIQHHANIVYCKPANVKAEKFRGMSRAELHTHMCRRRMFQAWVFNLAGNLIYTS